MEGVLELIFVLAHWDAVTQSITAALTFGTAVIAWAARKHAKRASLMSETIEDAVNHRHKYDGNPPRLYDIALENRARLDDREKAEALLFSEIGHLRTAVHNHVEWEEQEKYGELHQLIERLHTAADKLPGGHNGNV